MTIDKKFWQPCSICGFDVSKEVVGANNYRSCRFKEHVENEHKITLEEYFSKFESPPICSCGICKKQTKVAKRGANFYWREMACGRNRGVRGWSKRAKIERLGENNPMFGKTPWNKGETKESHPSMMNTSKKMIGRQVSESTRAKQSESAKSRDFHGHTGCKHTQETKDKARARTLKMIRDGKFKQTRSRPHIAMCDILEDLGISYEEEKVVECWSFDIFLIKSGIYIEVDGDYFHSNPMFYAEPKTKTQKINWYRDLKKNKFCDKMGMSLIRFWEYDILNNKEMIKCELEKLNR